MDEKTNAVIEKIKILSQQNEEFNSELRKILNVSVDNSAIIDDERLSQIYEYCIEKILRKQAEEFYKDFPINSLIPFLVEDFARMELFRRKDNFGDFCLSLYQQIECITNKLCENSMLDEIASKMWAYPAYIIVEKGEEPNISKRSSGEFNIASLVFTGKDKDGNPNSIKKSQSSLQALYAMDKVRSIVYFLGYKAMMRSSDFDCYVEITSLLYDLYYCRNMNHRGNTPTQNEIDCRNRIIPLKSLYYFKFMGLLAQYVEFIKSGYSFLNKIKQYSDQLCPKKVTLPGPKTVGFIDLNKVPKR